MLICMLTKLRGLAGSPEPGLQRNRLPLHCERQQDGTFVVSCKKCGEEIVSGIGRSALYQSAGMFAQHTCLAMNPLEAFHAPNYLRLNARQLGSRRSAQWSSISGKMKSARRRASNVNSK